MWIGLCLVAAASVLPPSASLPPPVAGQELHIVNDDGVLVHSVPAEVSDI